MTFLGENMRTEKKNLLVVGASSGIGKAIACQCASQGENLILVSRNKSKLMEIKNDFPNNIIEIVGLDLDQLNDIYNLFNMIRDRDIKLDGLIYCAGDYIVSMIKNMVIEQYQRIMRVNVLGFCEMAKYFMNREISNKNSSIIAISSLASIGAPKALGAYASSKAALNSLVQVMAKEGIRRKIRVNAILPGWVDTPMAQKSFKETGNNMNDSILSTQPFGIIPPDQVAYLVEFLLSDKAKYITGALLPISGGDIQ